MEPVPPAKDPDGIDMRQLVRLLFSGSLLAAPAAVDHDAPAAVDHDAAAASKQPSVTLREWWLATVEGDDQKIAVAGSFLRNQSLYELGPTPIAKRHAPNILESEDGLTLLISGSLSKSRTLRNGYSNTVYEHFMFGFPRWWQSCNQRYPKQKNRTPSDGNIATNENAAASSEAGKEGQRTPVVTLEVQGCREDTQHMASTEKEAVAEEMPTPVYLDVQNTFSLSTILEEYTCDGDIPTNEDAAASNDGNERYRAPSKEVNNAEIGLIADSPSSTHNAVSEAVDSAPATDRKKTPVACLKNQGSLGGNQHIASNKKKKHASTGGRSHTLSPTCSVILDLMAASPSSERGHDHIATDVSLAPTVQCTNNAVSEALYSIPATDHKTTPVACLKDQGSLGANQHIASNKKPVGRPKKPHKKHHMSTRSHGTRSPLSHHSATRSDGTRSPLSQVLWSPLSRSKATSMSISTPEDLELKRSRSGRLIVPHLEEGYQSIVYGRDGLIAGVIGLDPPAMPKRSGLKTYQRKKRRTG